MSKFTLIYVDEDHQGNEVCRVQHSFELDYLHDVINYMGHFLKGCGYHYEGELGVIEDE